MKIFTFSLIASLLSFSGGAAAWIGIDYGIYHKTGQSPQIGSVVPKTQIVNDLKLISNSFSHIKTYGIDNKSNLSQVVPLISTNKIKYGKNYLQVYQGVYESNIYNSGAGGNTEYLDRAVAYAIKYPNIITAIVVGNECLDRDANCGANCISAKQLLQDMQYVKTKLVAAGSSVQVTTGLTYARAVAADNPFANQPSGVDFVMVNLYPWYAPVSSSNGYAAIQDNLNSFTFGTTPVQIGETGWPNGPPGTTNGAATASAADEKIYISSLYSHISSLPNTFIFEAFDEPWLSVTGAIGPYWGLWTGNTRTQIVAVPPN